MLFDSSFRERRTFYNSAGSVSVPFYKQIAEQTHDIFKRCNVREHILRPCPVDISHFSRDLNGAPLSYTENIKFTAKFWANAWIDYESVMKILLVKRYIHPSFSCASKN